MVGKIKYFKLVEYVSVCINCRYVPNSLYLAISELDEANVGRFTFRTKEGFMQVSILR